MYYRHNRQWLKIIARGVVVSPPAGPGQRPGGASGGKALENSRDFAFFST